MLPDKIQHSKFGNDSPFGLYCGFLDLQRNLFPEDKKKELEDEIALLKQ